MKLLKAAALAAVIGLLAGCSTHSDPPAPSPTTTTPTSNVPTQLDPFAAAPCTLLTDAQRTALNGRGFVVRSGRVKPNAQVPTCEYGDIQHRETGTLWVDAFVVTDSGLAELVSNHAKGSAADYWKPGTIAGHSSIYYADQASPEFCDVAIGITDTSHIGVAVIQFNSQKPREQGSCEATTAVAEQVLATVTGGK